MIVCVTGFAALIAGAFVTNHLFAQGGAAPQQQGTKIAVINIGHVFNNYVVSVRRRDELKQFLAEQGIQSEVYYPVPLHLQACFAGLGYKKGYFPRAELAAKEVLALPLYPELTPAQQQTVVGAVKEFYRP